jgi:gas vesicle protein
MTSSVRAGLIGAGIGGAAMFLFDPDRGARRRALVRDKSVRIARKTRDAADATRRDLGNRLEGVRSRVRARFHEDMVSDSKLYGRVRAALGRASSHPRAIGVSVSDGTVRLTGDALASEVGAIESAVSGVRGVHCVECELHGHEHPEGIPSLQGASTPPDARRAWLGSGWSPTARLACSLAAGGAGLALASLARRRRGGADGIDEGAIDVLTVEMIPVDVVCDGDAP